jgi:hypothetical protein
MNRHTDALATLSREFKIQVHEPFAEFLQAAEDESHFFISLLDCYRLAGHACHAMTGAFLSTQAAVRELFPATQVCERGDIAVEFGSALHERATGPRSNVVSYITGAWGETGFPGLKGRFSRKNLMSYGARDLSNSALRFRRLSDGTSVIVDYQASEILAHLKHDLEFPQSWRAEICAILADPSRCLRISKS